MGLALVAGCQSAHEKQPLPPALYGSDTDAQLEFWHTMAERRLTSNNEAFHGILLYADGQDPATTYEARVAALKSRKMLPQGFNRPADEAVSRGDLAVAVVRVLQMKGGLMMHVLGPMPRYATRELVFNGIYPISSPQQTFSGSEFVGVIGKLEDVQNPQKAEAPPPAAGSIPPANTPGGPGGPG